MKKAFPFTIPVLTGYTFLGLTYGILMNKSGFNFVLTFLMCVLVYGGSLQYLGVVILGSAFNPITTLVITLIIHARHIFYGIAMLDKYKDVKGLKKLYVIYSLTDETFSINCSVDIPEGVDKTDFLFSVSLLDQMYWVIASVAGSIIGNVLNFNTKGLDFVMTAMFIVILLEQILKSKNHTGEIIGMVASILSLIIFGADSFLIPAMICIIIGLMIFRKNIEGVRNDN